MPGAQFDGVIFLFLSWFLFTAADSLNQVSRTSSDTPCEIPGRKNLQKIAILSR